MAENSISYGMGLSDQMINQMLQSDDPTIKAQAQDYINQSQTQQEEKPSLLQRIGNFFISPAASAEVDINQNQNTLDENQLNYLLRSSYLPSGKGIQGLDSLGVGPNLNYLGKGMQGLESLGIGPNLNYLGDGPMTGSIGVGPNQNYLGKGMQIGSMGQPLYDSGIQTIFPSNMSPALSDLGGITPSFGVANEDDDEQDQEYIDQVEKSNNPLKGIMDLLRNIPTPFNLARRGLEALRGSESLSDFRNSRTGAEFFKRRRDREALARDPNVFRDARNITSNLRRTAADNVIDRGRGENNISNRTNTSPRRTSSQSGMQAARTRSRDLGSMRGGVGR